MGVGRFCYAAGGCEGVEFGLFGLFGRHCCCDGVDAGKLFEKVVLFWGGDVIRGGVRFGYVHDGSSNEVSI